MCIKYWNENERLTYVFFSFYLTRKYEIIIEHYLILVCTVYMKYVCKVGPIPSFFYVVLKGQEFKISSSFEGLRNFRGCQKSVRINFTKRKRIQIFCN